MTKQLIEANKLDENYKYFLKMIFEARKNAGITQTKLAKLLKTNQSYVSKYENGDRRLDVLEFLKVMHAIDVSPIDIIANLERNWKK